MRGWWLSRLPSGNISDLGSVRIQYDLCVGGGSSYSHNRLTHIVSLLPAKTLISCAQLSQVAKETIHSRENCRDMSFSAHSELTHVFFQVPAKLINWMPLSPKQCFLVGHTRHNISTFTMGVIHFAVIHFAHNTVYLPSQWM